MLNIKSIVLGELGNNCYLITDSQSKKSALVDCTDSSQKMIDFIGDADLEYILLTHGHFDHIGGVKRIKDKYGAKIVISEEDAPMLSSPKLSLAVFCGASQENTRADILVGEGSEIFLGNTKIKVISTPGHTKGGVCYLTDEAVFTGDTLFFCSCGRTDFPGGSAGEIMKSLHRLSKLDPKLKVYPGHDRFTTLAFEKQNNPYMR
ncbi:MAG: MBL fold metallo-hydrolase [Clostridiales bacterium]|nr:MBL fold metallo-hydrolase [Clostridiales bacterium]